MKPLVSVIIPNHNYAHFVSQAIDSALAQTHPHLEVIVVNNGSTDGSAEVLRGYGNRIRWIEQDNRGQSGARNRGIEESRGELIAFLDADDVWSPTKLEKQFPFFENPDVGLVYCGYTTVDRELHPMETCIPELRGRIYRKFAEGVGAVITGGESTAVMRKRCFEELGLYDTELSISAGWDMYRRICSRYAIEVVREPLMLYRQHGSNAHHRIPIYEHNVLLRLKKMFEDPLAAEILPLKRQAYGKTYLALAGSYMHQKQLGKTLWYAARSAVVWPRSLVYIAGTPFRLMRRSWEAHY